MDSSKILYILKHSPSVALLNARNKDFIIMFFAETFLQQTAMSSEDIHNRLSDFLEQRDVEVDEEIEIVFSDTYEARAKKYIQKWADVGFLTNYQNETGEIFYELSSHSSKTIDWLLNLKKEEYIGTESKFKTLFNQLKELVEFTNENREKRLQLLEDKKLEIEQQIQRLKMGEDVKVFEEYEIVPRFNQLSKLAKELLSDFKEVDGNFKTIIKEIYQKHTDTTLKKSHILQYTFDALDELKDSSQGKSFYAFWEFLLSRDLQEEWKDLVQELYQTLEEKEIYVNDSFLKNMKQHLYDSGRKVYKTNDKMAEKLSRIIRENDVSKAEVTKNVIQEIKNLLIHVNKKKGKPDFAFEIETDFEINIPFERKLTFEQSEEIEYKSKPKAATTNFDELNNLGKIFNSAAIDKNELRKIIKNVLKEKSQVTILDIIDNQGGISKGLPELFGYISVVKDFKYTVNADKKQIILFDKKNKKVIQIPEIILTR
ncbi:hypothetical protein EZS27_022727 [termite gut metagenome]|uniref:DUF3375 domain-containing protein n=1 Tax=termite gut metagenome TaxID=433724 RepID=A0A5J4R438_9ZZZZ